MKVAALQRPAANDVLRIVARGEMETACKVWQPAGAPGKIVSHAALLQGCGFQMTGVIPAGRFNVLEAG